MHAKGVGRALMQINYYSPFMLVCSGQGSRGTAEGRGLPTARLDGQPRRLCRPNRRLATRQGAERVAETLAGARENGPRTDRSLPSRARIRVRVVFCDPRSRGVLGPAIARGPRGRLSCGGGGPASWHFVIVL